MKKYSRFFMIIFFYILAWSISQSFGADWFVRPRTGKALMYGEENGSSYYNAWNGLSNIRWGKNGINPGDSLYVCDMHPHPEDSLGIDHSQEYIDVKISGKDGAPITIRGDYDGHPGTIVRTRNIIRWRKYKFQEDGWKRYGDEEIYIYKHSVFTSLTNPIEYHVDTKNFRRIDYTNNLPEKILSLWEKSGTLHLSKDKTLYYKPSEGAIDVRLYNYRYWAIKISGKDHIVVRNIRLIGGAGAGGLIFINNGSDYLTIDEVDIEYAGWDGIKINDNGATAPCNDITISKCSVLYSRRAGIYLRYAGQQSDRIHVHHNHIA